MCFRSVSIVNEISLVPSISSVVSYVVSWGEEEDPKDVSVKIV